MIRVNVKVDIAALKREFPKMTKQINRAAARAINRGVDAGATVAGREISAASKIKVREIRKRMWIRGASPDKLVNEMGALPYAPNLRYFRPTENKVGVAATAWEGRKTYKHAFILPSGKVIARVGKERTPTKTLYGPSVPAIFMRPGIVAKITERAIAIFKSTFDHEVTRRLR